MAAYSQEKEGLHGKGLFQAATAVSASTSQLNPPEYLALKALNKEGCQTYNRSVKYKNNIIESDHRDLVVPKRLCKPPKQGKMKPTLEVLLCQEKTGKITASYVK